MTEHRFCYCCCIVVKICAQSVVVKIPGHKRKRSKSHRNSSLHTCAPRGGSYERTIDKHKHWSGKNLCTTERIR